MDTVTASPFERLAAVDCTPHIESKNGLSYLSWAWAVHYLLKEDPNATWSYQFWDGQPFCLIGDTAMVFCTVKAFGLERTAQLPVMNHRNQPIPNPNAFEVNTAMQRCLAKAIALHGCGLFIYQGEDLPVLAQGGDDDEADHARAVASETQTVSPIADGKNLSGDISNTTNTKSLDVETLETIKALSSKAKVSAIVICKKHGVGALEQLTPEQGQEVVARLQEIIKQKLEKANAKATEKETV